MGIPSAGAFGASWSGTRQWCATRRQPHLTAPDPSFPLLTVTFVPSSPAGRHCIFAALSTSAHASNPSARRSAVAGLLGLIVPGAGHAILGRRYGMLLFFLLAMDLLVQFRPRGKARAARAPVVVQQQARPAGEVR